jgi:hypothetical protein
MTYLWAIIGAVIGGAIGFGVHKLQACAGGGG